MNSSLRPPRPETARRAAPRVPPAEKSARTVAGALRALLAVKEIPGKARRPAPGNRSLPAGGSPLPAPPVRGKSAEASPDDLHEGTEFSACPESRGFDAPFKEDCRVPSSGEA